MSAETLLAYRTVVRIASHARFALTRIEADTLREAGYDVTGHPDFLVHALDALDALDIEIRACTIDRMRLAAECQRTMGAVLSGELRHDG